MCSTTLGHDVHRRGRRRTPRGRLPGRGGRRPHRAAHRGAAASGPALGRPDEALALLDGSTAATTLLRPVLERAFAALGEPLGERHLHHDRGDLHAVWHPHPLIAGGAEAIRLVERTPRQGGPRAPVSGIPRRGRPPRRPPGSAGRGRAASNRAARTWRARAPARGGIEQPRILRRLARSRCTACRGGSSRRRRPARRRPRPRSRCHRRSACGRRWRCTRSRPRSARRRTRPGRGRAWMPSSGRRSHRPHPGERGAAGRGPIALGHAALSRP